VPRSPGASLLHMIGESSTRGIALFALVVAIIALAVPFIVYIVTSTSPSTTSRSSSWNLRPSRTTTSWEHGSPRRAPSEDGLARLPEAKGRGALW